MNEWVKRKRNMPDQILSHIIPFEYIWCMINVYEYIGILHKVTTL